MPTETTQPHHVKMKAWTLPTVLGLIMSVVGAVGIIELRPQLSVSPQEQLDKSKPFSAPFRITNAGYLAVRVVYVTCYTDQGKAGPVNFKQSAFYGPQYDGVILERGEPETMLCNMGENEVHLNGQPLKVESADMAVIIDARNLYVPFTTARRYFRFKGNYFVDGWQWIAQPADQAFQDRANGMVDSSIKQREEIRARLKK